MYGPKVAGCSVSSGEENSGRSPRNLRTASGSPSQNSAERMCGSRGEATAVTSLLYLVPPTTALMAWVLFGESFTPVMMLGMAVTVVAVAIVVRSPGGSQSRSTPVEEIPG